MQTLSARPQIAHISPPSGTLSSLLALRWISLGGQTLVLIGLTAWLQVDLPIALISPALFALAAANVLGYQQLRSAVQITDQQLLAHLIVDFLALSWVLYCTGGASNPFASLLLLPLTMSAITLPGRWLWVTTPLAIIIYTSLVFYNVPLPPPQGNLQVLDQVLAETCSIGGSHADNQPGSGFALHIAGMWVNFALSAGIVYFFLARQSMRLRQHELTLHALRERSLREEKILAIGLMAAGAAHKLGTPLATLSIMLGEADPDNPLDSDDIALMREQIGRCKSILSDMVASATPQARNPLPIVAWATTWVDEWHVLRPSVLRPEISFSATDNTQDLLVRPDRALDQAIQGLLDNAADANISVNSQPSEAPPRLLVTLTLSQSTLQIDILDHGPGVPEHIAKRLGSEFVNSSKSDHADVSEGGDILGMQVGGLGIGFFLTHATIERFDGKVELFPHSPQGTCTRITLPLSRIL